MAQLRDASSARGQGNKATTHTNVSAGKQNRGNGKDGHTKASVPKTLATRKPKRWGGNR